MASANVDTEGFAKTVQGNTIQTFRNYVDAIITHQVKGRMKRDGLLIILDEFDVIKDKLGIGSIIKSLTSESVKFCICGIGRDLQELVSDHASVERLLEQGAVHVTPMPKNEINAILERAEELFNGKITFSARVREKIIDASEGYPYFAQLIGKQCVEKCNENFTGKVDNFIYSSVLDDVKSGKSFPTLESAYQRAIGESEDRKLLLTLLAEQKEDSRGSSEDIRRVYLKHIRSDAEDFNISHVDQILPRLVEEKFGPILSKIDEKPGIYEFVNPVFRLYVRLRTL